MDEELNDTGDDSNETDGLEKIVETSEEVSDDGKQDYNIVTYNGACFDLPFISSKLGIKFDQLHVDLRFAYARLGISGGLKKIENMFDLERSLETKGLDGFDAVNLWHKYVNGDDNALRLLKRYNEEDVIGLKILGKRAYSMLKERLVSKI